MTDTNLEAHLRRQAEWDKIGPKLTAEDEKARLEREALIDEVERIGRANRMAMLAAGSADAPAVVDDLPPAAATIPADNVRVMDTAPSAEANVSSDNPDEIAKADPLDLDGDGTVEKAELLTVARNLGIDADGRWGVKRLQAAIADAQKAAPNA